MSRKEKIVALLLALVLTAFCALAGWLIDQRRASGAQGEDDIRRITTIKIHRNPKYGDWVEIERNDGSQVSMHIASINYSYASLNPGLGNKPSISINGSGWKHRFDFDTVEDFKTMNALFEKVMEIESTETVYRREGLPEK